jgi:hypothetical protein
MACGPHYRKTAEGPLADPPPVQCLPVEQLAKQFSQVNECIPPALVDRRHCVRNKFMHDVFPVM